MELLRVEATISAISSGNLATDSWSHSHVLALGLSGQRNPLGSAVLHLIEHPTHESRRTVLAILCQTMQTGTIEQARHAINWFEDAHCPLCSGRGVIDFQQTQCPECHGSGDRKLPSDKTTQDAISLLNSSVDQLEHQQRARLK